VAAWHAHGITVLSLEEAQYPSLLRDLKSPPPLLYLRGALGDEDKRAVAVVGTRDPTSIAARLSRRLARGLAERGFTIVSGLARGVDTAAHRGALAAKQGRTVAVLGSGLLNIYPPENALLAARIRKRGCLLAEVPPDAQVDRRLLLARDRIQAALSLAVIVVQAYPECGSIVTAQHALRCRRTLFGVPWPQGPFADGWRQLHLMGAHVVERDVDLDALAAQLDSGPAPADQHPLL
jgi:DNA processing protein